MKLLFVVTEDWYFLSHRLPMARAAQRAGYDIAVATHVGACREPIEAAGVRVIPLSLDRRSLNPLRALLHIARLAAIYRREKPHVVHHIAMKPVLFGSVAALISPVPAVINALAGLGYVFTSRQPLAKTIRLGLVPALRLLMRRKNTTLLLQNPDDRIMLASYGIGMPGRTRIIRGSGVDLDAFPETPLPQGPPFICVFAGRMIDIKGLPTLKAAFDILARSHPYVTLWLCGAPDAANPGSWTEQALRAWEAQSPNVVYKGQCAMADIWPRAHLALQPSLGGEGVPKSLLEAAASGRPIIASDVAGCRETVENGVNGILVPPRDATGLASAIGQIADHPDICRAMAANSRALVQQDLSAEAVGRQAETLYASLKPVL